MYQYKPEDVDCKYCAEWRHRQCQAAGCPWLAERIEAGKVSYATVILKLFRNVKDADIVRRFGQLVQSFCYGCARYGLGCVRPCYRDAEKYDKTSC